MTILTLIQDFCELTNLSVPLSVHGSADQQVLQIKALVNAEGRDLVTRGNWQQLTKEATHTTVATESQGNIDTITGDSFSHFINDAFWDRTSTLPLNVISEQDWQAEKAVGISGFEYSVRLRGNLLVSTPTPSAGSSWVFEYISKNWLINGSTYKSKSTLDDDDFLLPDDLILAGLRWRWKSAKGFEYAEDFTTYEKMVEKALGHNKPRRNLVMSDGTRGKNPKIVISNGNWPL